MKKLSLLLFIILSVSNVHGQSENNKLKTDEAPGSNFIGIWCSINSNDTIAIGSEGEKFYIENQGKKKLLTLIDGVLKHNGLNGEMVYYISAKHQLYWNNRYMKFIAPIPPPPHPPAPPVEGAIFMGQWHSINSADSITINNEGEDFVLESHGDKIVLKYKDGMLQNAYEVVKYHANNKHLYWGDKEMMLTKNMTPDIVNAIQPQKNTTTNQPTVNATKPLQDNSGGNTGDKKTVQAGPTNDPGNPSNTSPTTILPTTNDTVLHKPIVNTTTDNNVPVVQTPTPVIQTTKNTSPNSEPVQAATIKTQLSPDNAAKVTSDITPASGNISDKTNDRSGKTEILTNADIIKMSKIDLPPTSIINKIKISKTNFDISVDALVELKKQGVSSTVIDEMMNVGINARKEAITERKEDFNSEVQKQPENVTSSKNIPDIKHAMQLTKKGNKVFVEIPDEASRGGERYFITTLNAWGYWDIVSNVDDADFIIVFHIEKRAMGIKASWALLETTDGREFRRSDTYKQGAAAWNGYNAFRAAADKLVNKYFKNEFQ